MNTAIAAAPAGMATLRQQASAWWRGRSARERQAVLLVAAVVALFVVWSLFVQPAWRTVRAAPAQLDQLDAQVQQMQRVAAESAALRGTAPVAAAQASLALKSASDRLGDRGRLNLQGDRATLTLNGVAPDALRGWLTEVRSGARARPVDAQLQRVPQGYNGTITVTFGGAAP